MSPQEDDDEEMMVVIIIITTTTTVRKGSLPGVEVTVETSENPGGGDGTLGPPPPSRCSSQRQQTEPLSVRRSLKRERGSKAAEGPRAGWGPGRPGSRDFRRGPLPGHSTPAAFPPPLPSRKGPHAKRPSLPPPSTVGALPGARGRSGVQSRVVRPFGRPDGGKTRRLSDSKLSSG